MFQKNNLLKRFTIVCIVVFIINLPQSFAQKIIQKTTEKERIEWYGKHLKMTQKSQLKNLPWQFVGPTNISGRMTDVEVVTPKGKNYTIYVAGASGGIWKTNNEGVKWKPIFENKMSTSIGDIALDPHNQNIIWAGTGEANIFRSSQAGAGIYRSKDAGKTWDHLGLINTNTIARIIVHPQNSNIVYVAASGHEWTNNQERGVFKTIDGGKSWEKILYIDDKTGANDLVMDPTNPNILYASTWQRIRKKWNDPRNEEDYKGSGIYKTIDGGNNWVNINEGLPNVKYRGRIGIDLCKSKPNVLYAFVDNYERLTNKNELNKKEDAYGRPSSGRIKGASIYRSDDFGASWIKKSEQNSYMEGLSGTYGWVFGQIRVDPVDANKIYVMGLALNLSVDGGKTFHPLKGMHGDHHGLWIDPKNTNYLVNVNDGGVAISYDGKNFRTFYDNLPIAQFFNVNVDMAKPFYVYGSVQDHGSYRGIVDMSRGRDAIAAVEFKSTPGGEGSNHAIDPTNTNIVYSAGFYGTMNRTDISTNKNKEIMPPTPEGVERLRGQWLAPFIISPHNPRILYHGTQFLHRSMNQGESWEKISADLTYNNPDKKGDIPYQTIFSISESPCKFGLIYAGTDDGRVWITRNSGLNWEEINKGISYGKWVSELFASKFDEATVYISQNGKREYDWAVYLWKSVDFGKTWTDISNNIPCGPINVIKEDPSNENILYVGTDYGVYVSFNKGATWESLPGNFPTTYVQDLVIHPRDNIMVIATHGRGIWAINVEPIHAFGNADKTKVCTIFDFENAVLPKGSSYWYRNTIKPLNAGYYLNEKSEVNMIVKNNDGHTIASFELAAEKGLNYAKWNLMNTQEKISKPGLYKLVLSGKNFKEVKEFQVVSE